MVFHGLILLTKQLPSQPAAQFLFFSLSEHQSWSTPILSLVLAFVSSAIKGSRHPDFKAGALLFVPQLSNASTSRFRCSIGTSQSADGDIMDSGLAPPKKKPCVTSLMSW